VVFTWADGNVTLLNEGPFVIDHDQKLSLQGVMNYAHRQGFYATLSLRHDSGLVTGGAGPGGGAAGSGLRGSAAVRESAERPAADEAAEAIADVAGGL
jgi:hypothetical protein